MNGRFILLLTVFCSFAVNDFRAQTQKTELDFFNEAAILFYHGKYSDCSEVIDNGLKVYPNNQKLIKLKSNLPNDPKKPLWDKFYKDKAQLKAEGFSEGQGGEGYISEVRTDPNGKKHVFVKKSEPSGNITGEGPITVQKPQPPAPPSDSDDDGVIDSKDKCRDQKGPASNSGCPELYPIKLKKPSNTDNFLSWNSAFANSRKFKLRLTLIDEASREEYFSQDVSGKSSYSVPQEDITGHNAYKTTARLDITIIEPYTNTNGESTLYHQKFWCK